MKKLAVGLLCAGVLAVAGALGTSHYVGGKLQHAFEQTIGSWNGDGLTVELVSYDRGLLSAQAQTRWTVVNEDESYEITASHDVLHGPWPRGHAGRIDSRFALPDDSEPALVQALQGQALLQWRTDVHWQGDTQHAISSPAFAAKFDDASTLDWGGMKAELHLPHARDAAKGWLRAPSLRMVSTDTSSLETADTEVEFDLRLAEGLGFWTGPFKVQMGRLSAVDAERTEHLRAEQLQLDSQGSVKDGLAQLRLHTQAATAKLVPYDTSDFALTLTAQNVDANWLDETLAWLQGDLQDEAHRTELLRSLPLLLAGQPQLNMERLSFRTPAGVSEFSTKLAYVGTNPEVFNVTTDVQAAVRAALPKRLLEQWLTEKVRGDYEDLLAQMQQEVDDATLQASIDKGVGQRLSALVEAGFVREDGEALSVDLVYEQGEVRLNGTTIPLEDLLGIGQVL